MTIDPQIEIRKVNRRAAAANLAPWCRQQGQDVRLFELIEACDKVGLSVASLLEEGLRNAR